TTIDALPDPYWGGNNRGNAGQGFVASRPASTYGGRKMTSKLARYSTALIALAGLGVAGPALAQDKTVKIGVLNDMSSLYADIGGPNSVVAIKMAVEDSGLPAKGWKIDVLS